MQICIKYYRHVMCYICTYIIQFIYHFNNNYFRLNTITLRAELWSLETSGHCSVALSSLILFSSTFWVVFKVTVLPPIAAIIFSVTSWSYLVPRRLLITLASWLMLVDTNPAGKLILISSTMPFSTSKFKFRRCILPSWARKSSVRVTVNFGVLPKFQSQERNSLVKLSIPGNQSSVGLINLNPFCCSTRSYLPSSRTRAFVRKYSQPMADKSLSIWIWRFMSNKFFIGERTEAVAFVTIPFSFFFKSRAQIGFVHINQKCAVMISIWSSQFCSCSRYFAISVDYNIFTFVDHAL